MASSSPRSLPEVPAKHADFIHYIQSHPDKPLPDLLEPFKQYDATLREVFAQEPDHPALTDGYLNIVPVFNGHEKDLKIRARNPQSQSPEENERYVMTLDAADRRPDGSPAVVESLDEFKQNFSLFSEQSLADMDWSNVVAAGSAVVTSLLPVPAKYKDSKRALRQYYHEILAPASDVDLFIYGLNEEDAIKKIVAIERCIKDSILTEITTIRTKNAITIASQYPTRHIQIVLRIYKSVSEILTGFDVDCSCAAYDGKQIWTAPRALTAYMTQTNTIDLTRRSPSYENRLSKYSHRGFEVYWPLLERSRIDPTIYERNFGRTVGLARLLVLERLPSKDDRDSYMDERRRERGRPAINRRVQFGVGDNIKEAHEDEVAEWVDQEDVSDYHTFTIPYGPKYFAKKIEKLLYTKDILLNAEWNKKDDREVNLHRHPAFFGYAEDVIHDCCGFCPKPVTPEEIEVAEEEAKIYVSGEVSFIKDDPGRQAIGSFNPITDDDWTEMAYVGNTTRLCQAIVDQDLEHVEDWLSQDGSDPNCRDYTGRTPLHLAVMSSSPEVVRALIDHDARLVARLADGRTALHLAAARGDVEIVRMIMQRSEKNEAEEAEKEDARRKLRETTGGSTQKQENDPGANDDVEMVDKVSSSNNTKEISENTGLEDNSENEKSDDEMDWENAGDVSDDDAHSRTTGSFVKVEKEAQNADDFVLEENEDDPDVYDVNVLAWDLQCSPLHLAILHGHIDVVKELVQTFGADVLLPIKLLDADKSARGAILTPVIAMSLPLEKAELMTKTLLELGASSAQADVNQVTALHFIACNQPKLLDILFEIDEPAAKRAINHISVSGYRYSPDVSNALTSAIAKLNTLAAKKLLEKGAAPFVKFKDWIKAVGAYDDNRRRASAEDNKKDFRRVFEQPIVLAIENEMTEIAYQLIELGADPNTLTREAWYQIEYDNRSDDPGTVLDLVRQKIRKLRGYKPDKAPEEPEYKLKKDVDYLDGIEKNTYAYFAATKQIEDARESDKRERRWYEEALEAHQEQKGVKEKCEAIDRAAAEFEKLEKLLLEKGAETFQKLYPKNYRRSRTRSLSPRERSTTPFAIDLSFSVHDLEEETKAAYVKLFQAVWDNDIELVKSLTLSPWGNGNPPLLITVKDSIDCSTFCIAVMRGHFDLARALVEISFGQYQPEVEDTPKRYRLAEQNDDDSENSDVDISEDEVNDKFTVENVGEIAEAKSDTSPVSFMAFSFPVRYYAEQLAPDRKYFTYGVDDKKIEVDDDLDMETYAITMNDRTLFAFMIDLKVEWTDRMSESDESNESSPMISFAYSDFELAIRYGRVEILEEMIKHGGSGMQLESLVKTSGVKFNEKPKYYQGLSVHGKKRSDWIAAARGHRTATVSDVSPPLLKAAVNGSLRSVEWFMGDAPSRHYLDFAEANKRHHLITHLNQEGGGFEKVLKKWLNARHELALHCAVIAEPSPDTTKLIKYLLEVMPKSLEVKSANGMTPLALAFEKHRLDAAEILIKAGADQTVRTKEGCNILHLLISQYYMEVPENTLKPFLDLIDKRLLPSLLTERCSQYPGSLTPIVSWMRKNRESDENKAILQFLLTYAAPFENNKHLELLDATGDTPLHILIKTKETGYLEILLKHRPDLLFRENSVGRTPYELAEDIYVSSNVQDAPSVVKSYYRHESLVEKNESQFAPDYSDEGATEKTVWNVCTEWMSKAHEGREQDKEKAGQGKRILVSLDEANEVAKRLAARKRQQRSDGVRVNDDAEEEDVGKSVARDEVTEWARQY